MSALDERWGAELWEARGGFAQTPWFLFTNRERLGLSEAQALLLMALHGKCRGTDLKVSISDRKLMELTCWTRWTLRAHVAEVEALGLLLVTRGNASQSTTYDLQPVDTKLVAIRRAIQNATVEAAQEEGHEDAA